MPEQRDLGAHEHRLFVANSVCLMFRCQVWPVSVISLQGQEQIVLGAFTFTQLDSGGQGFLVRKLVVS